MLFININTQLKYVYMCVCLFREEGLCVARRLGGVEKND